MVKKSSVAPTQTKKSSVLSLISKKFDEGVKIGAFINSGPVDVLSTGSLSTDIALGIGGIARGSIVEISGQESTAKTTTCLRIVADAQRRGYTAAFIDTEHALDPTWVAKLGVKVHKDDPKKGMIIINADSLEKAGEVAVLLAKSGEFDVIIFDSIAGAPIEAQLEGDLGDANMGKRAKILSTFLPKLNGPVKTNGVWFVFTNQLRYSMAMYGDPFVTPGGKAVPFHSAQRIQLNSKKEKTAQGADPSFVTVTSKVIKNKLSPPFRSGEYDMHFSEGKVDVAGELSNILTDAKNLDILGIQRAGAFYTLPEEMVSPDYRDKGLRFQGAGKVQEMLFSDIEYLDETIIPYVRSKLILHGDQGYREHRGLKADIPDEDEDDYIEEEE